MSLLQKMRNTLARLMYGRNGVDQLGMVIIVGCLVLDMVSMAAMSRSRVAGMVLYWMSMALWAYAMFRIISKNVYKRREENSRWMQFRWKLKSGRQGAKVRRADKEHKYFTCKNCKAICRVPVGKGTVEITCPKCGAKIHGKT